MNVPTTTKRSPPGILALVKPSYFEWSRRVALNWLEIAVTLALANVVNQIWFYVVAILVLATRQHALAIMGHDAAHFTASRNRTINDWLACLFVFWPLGMGLDGYRKFHFAHHKWTGTPNDPELVHKRWAGREWETPITIARLTGYVAKDLAGFAVRDIFRLIQIVKPVSLRDKLGPLGWWTAALIAMYATGTLWMALLWWVSINTAYWAIFRLRMMTEHVGTASTHRVSASWWQRLVFMPHYTWCHYEHHRWPSIPCWNLSDARALDTDAPVIPVSTLWKTFKDLPYMPHGVPFTDADSESRPVYDEGAARTS